MRLALATIVKYTQVEAANVRGKMQVRSKPAFSNVLDQGLPCRFVSGGANRAHKYCTIR